MNFKRRTISLILAAILIVTTSSASAGSCPAYRPYEKAAVIGGAVGGVAGIAATAVISGAVVTAAVTATGTGIGAAIITDCLTTGCLITVAVGIAAGIAIAVAWIFGTSPEDCAGAIVLRDNGQWLAFYNFDTFGALRDRMEKRFGTDLEPVAIFAPYRYCAAAAEGKHDAYIAEGRTLIEATNKAMRSCRATERKCRLAIAQCNDG